MTDYRIYLLDARGRFARAKEHKADSDEEVLAAAAALDNAHGFEVWEGGRKVSPSSGFIPRVGIAPFSGSARFDLAGPFDGDQSPLR